MTPAPDVRLDSDVLRLIAENRILPTDTALAVLRRLLKLDKTPHGWHSDGVFLPNGTRIRMGLGADTTLNGEIRNGSWCIGSRKFPSPSAAANAFVAKARHKRNVRVNGWLYWQVKPPGAADFALLDSLRLAGAAAGADNVHAIGRTSGAGAGRAHRQAS